MSKWGDSEECGFYRPNLTEVLETNVEEDLKDTFGDELTINPNSTIGFPPVRRPSKEEIEELWKRFEDLYEQEKTND